MIFGVLGSWVMLESIDIFDTRVDPTCARDRRPAPWWLRRRAPMDGWAVILPPSQLGGHIDYFVSKFQGKRYAHTPIET